MIANTVLCAIPRIDISFIVLEHSERLLTDFWARRCDRQVAIDKCGRSFEPSTNLVLGAQAKELAIYHRILGLYEMVPGGPFGFRR